MESIDNLEDEGHHYTLAHELGHVLGLGHSNVLGNLMNAGAEGTGPDLTDAQCSLMAHDAL